MKISIDRMIFEEFPLARIGWLRASVNVSPVCERVKELKKQLEGRLNDIGLSADTVALHPDIARWRNTYSKMGVKPSKFRSSIESLLRRVFKGDVWSVSNVVDCYDCVSAVNLLPMGAHDIAKLKGDLTLRYGRQGEKFCPLGAGESEIEVDPRNVVYADDEKVCCWLWNYRDTREASVSEETKEALFLVDNAFETEWRTVEEGLVALAEELENIGCNVAGYGVVDAASPSVDI